MRTSSSRYSATLLRLGDIGVDGLAVPVGVRWNPFKGQRQQVKPFIGAAVGPVTAALNRVTFSSPFGTDVIPETHPTTIGGRVGGGFDIHFGRSFSVGIGADYTAMKRISRSLAGSDPRFLGFGEHTTFAGPQVTVAAGWLFGRGSAGNKP
jgi:hypothetical protein